MRSTEPNRAQRRTLRGDTAIGAGPHRDDGRIEDNRDPFPRVVLQQQLTLRLDKLHRRQRVRSRRRTGREDACVITGLSPTGGKVRKVKGHCLIHPDAGWQRV